ncbi:TetR/AcrR family transcriptional regulator [Sphingobium sp. AN558]|uniref:TetR/AcrR family transcriptional regulator n=1 Tax=Sphingobium sp. AN558 TaxID=3133442 RepID=UPI0030C5BE24
MKVSRERAAHNRDAVVEAASRLFRSHGVDGVSIGEIMQESGLTHGGFYKQFGSKEALAAEACARALERGAERWRGIIDAAAPGDEVKALTQDYLSARNRDAAETGCALVAVGTDSARKGGALATAFRGGMEGLADILTERTGDRSRALAHLSQMVGAMVLARAVGDPALSEEILEAARGALDAGPD